MAKIGQTTSPFIDAVFVNKSGRLLMLNKAGGLELAEVRDGKATRVVLRHDPENGEGMTRLDQSTPKATLVSQDGSVFEMTFEEKGAGQ